ncbi:MAG: hypothetical protein D6732_00210 [Methanobacteriota archaeon]|nr:MAG: hypothetical protein D6732_00210 [Euryarchaeota archaeon]
MHQVSTELISETVSDFLAKLHYEYMLVVVIVTYGLYYSNNFQWINYYFSPVRKKGRTRGVWLIGAVLGVMELIRYLPILFDDWLTYYQKTIHLLYSFIVIQVFVDDIVKLLDNWLVIVKFKKKEKQKDDRIR